MPGRLRTFTNKLVDPGEITRANVGANQQLADVLFAQTIQPPQIQHGAQGLAHLVNALNSQIYRQRAERGQKQLQEQEAAQLGQLLQGLPPQQAQMIQSLPPQMQEAAIGQIVQNQLTPPDPAQVTTKQFREGDQFVTRRIDNGMPDMSPAGIISTSPIDRVQRTEQGPPGAFSRELGTTEDRSLTDNVVAAKQFADTAFEAFELSQDAPDAGTFIARIAGTVNDLQNEARAFARNVGIEFDPSALDPDQYAETFDRLGIQGARDRAVWTQLAFTAAIANGQTGQGLSNRDVERFVQIVGGTSSDPRARRTVLRDLARRIARNTVTEYDVRTRTPGSFSQEFGEDFFRLNRFETNTLNLSEIVPNFDNLSEGAKREIRDMTEGMTPEEVRQALRL